MLTSKQRAKLKGIGNSYDTILQIGKSDIGNNLIKQVNDALAARELIKLRVLENSMLSPREAAQEVAEKTDSEVVQVIGTRFLLYRRNEKEPGIELD